jgi:hypothetical protein
MQAAFIDRRPSRERNRPGEDINSNAADFGPSGGKWTLSETQGLSPSSSGLERLIVTEGQVFTAFTFRSPCVPK